MVLILVDDLGAECLGSYGGRSYATPHLDALASAGTRFENCYATPLCTPSRVMAMTGLYPFRTGHTRVLRMARGAALSPRWTNFAQVLSERGYRTAISGKWQLGNFQYHPNLPRQLGFDEYCLWLHTDWGHQVSRYWNPQVFSNGRRLDGLEERYGPDVFCDYLIDFISRSRSEPFLAYYPMTLVHRPFQPTPDQWRALDVLPERFQSVWFDSVVEYMDKLVGRLVRHLEELALLEDTLILFTSDNGTDAAITSELDGRPIEGGKGRLVEAGTRVPLIARWAGRVPGGRTTDELVDLSDLLPTLAEVAGGPLPAEPSLDGRSFAPVLLGDERVQRRENVFIQREEAWFVRDRRWRLHEDGRLFDLADRYSERTAEDSDVAWAARARLTLAVPNELPRPPTPVRAPAAPRS